MVDVTVACVRTGVTLLKSARALLAERHSVATEDTTLDGLLRGSCRAENCFPGILSPSRDM